MKSPIRVFVVAIIAGIAIVGVSLLWPRFMANKRPVLLQTIRDNVVSTEAGKNAVKVLGIENESGIQPFSVSQIAASVSGAVLSAVGEKAKSVIAEQVSLQVINQYQQMPAQEQQTIRNFICKPEGQ